MRIFKAILFLIFTPSVQFSQANGQLIEASLDINTPFTITQYATKHGLPQSQVLDIVSKKNGNLILATANGIVEYNGAEFKSIINDERHKANLYYTLFWHEKTQQLFGAKIDGETFLLFPKFKTIEKCVTSYIDKDTIYCADVNGDIYSAWINNLNFKKITKTYLKNPKCLFIENGILLIGTKNGAFKFNLKTKQRQQIITGEILKVKKNFFDSSIYIIADKFIYKLKNTKVTSILPQKLNDKDVIYKDITFIDNISYLIASSVGLYYIKSNHIEYYSQKSYFPSPSLQCLHYNETENCVFIGTSEKGLLKLQFKNNYSHSSKQGFRESSSINSIIQTNSGDILVAENNGGVFAVENDTVYKYCAITGTYASLAEIDSVIYAGTWGDGIALIKNKKYIGRINAPNQLPNNNVHASFKDSKGTIWIGTSNGVAKGKSAQTLQPYLTKKIKGVVICFYELKDQTLCIGGSEGVYILDKKDSLIKIINKKNGLLGKEVRCFYEDKFGKIWIGTYGGGLYCYNNNTLVNIHSLKNCKLDIDVFCLAKDYLGYIYITSNHGLWRVKEKNLNDFYFRRIDYLIPFYYGEETGILNTEFNGGFQNNYLKTKSNRFYFPCLEGIVITTPEKIIDHKLFPVIDKVFINDTLYNSTNRVFERNTFSIQFDFSCVNFSDKYNTYFQYKLAANNIEAPSSWSQLQKTKTINFKLLPPGKYTFYLRAIDGFNSQKPITASYSFEIKHHYYETFWFKICSAVIVCLFAIIYFRLRIRRNRKEAEDREFIKRNMAELELKAIQAQLNPHFIFNCLNTIKYFILDEDFEKANKGLNHFSKMLRDAINNSEQPYITIKNEIAFLTDYLELEKMRLEDKLDFKIICDPEKQSTEIPAMIIQPHVENAMKHGISNLMDKKGKLVIEFIFQLLYIEIKIKDNGIGRKAASKISKRPNHVSKGINLTIEKSEILKRINKTEITTTITDLYNKTNIPIGTLVTINIPLYDHSNN